MYLSKFIGKNTEYVILAHLSEINNVEAKALKEFEDRNKKIKNVIIAKQKEPTELIEI
jgi:hypothetical protein